jgi:hypothetical protein
MATDSNLRIAKRDEAARDFRRSQGAFKNTVSGIGLAIADTWDWATGWITNDRPTFMGFTTMGLMRGALYGGLLGIAVIGFGGIVASANIVFLTLAAAGAAWYGMRDGEKGLENHQRSGRRHFSDWIAQKSGAVPSLEQTQAMEKKFDALSKEPAHKHATYGHGDEMGKGNFAAREDARRAMAAHAERLH